MSEYINLNDNVYFAANFYHPASGFSYAASATPRWMVWESGATLILQGDMTVRSTIVGSYWGTFAATAANGFTSNRFYDVQVSGTVDGISGFSKVKEFVLADIYNVNLVQVSGLNISPANIIDANVVQVSGVNVSLSDFGIGTAPTVTQIRQEMDTNSLVLTAISGEVAGLNGAAMRGTDNAVLAVNLDAVSGVINTISTNVTSVNNDIIAMSGSILQANIVQVSGQPILIEDMVDANITQVSGVSVSIENFRNPLTTIDLYNQASGALVNYDVVSYADLLIRTLPSGEYSVSSLTASQIRQEMDANSLMFTAISGEVAGLNGCDIHSDIMAVSGSIIDANIVQTSGEWVSIAEIVDANIIQVSGIPVSLSDFGASATAIRTEMDANSLMFAAISGDVAGLDGAAMRGTDNAALATNLNAVSGIIPTTQDIYNQASGALVNYDVATYTDLSSINTDMYFAHIKYISDLTNNQDEFVVQWFKNDQSISSGELTNPRLSVYNTSNGSALINGVAMSYASPNLGVVRYNSAMVLASGEPYLIETSGTIDAITRVWKTIVGIDLI